jgi:hypothetical protein
MIEGKRIKFGYGSVVLEANNGRLSVVIIEPPAEIGADVDYKEHSIVDRIDFSIGEDVFELNRNMKNVTKDNAVVKFRDYYFDFTNYNEQSVKIASGVIDSVVLQMMRFMAC